MDADMGGRARLSHSELLELKRWNTPTIYNGWEQITDRDAVFSVPRKLRNEGRNRFVDVQLLPLRQQVNEHRRDGLRTGEEVEERGRCCGDEWRAFRIVW